MDRVARAGDFWNIIEPGYWWNLGAGLKPNICHFLYANKINIVQSQISILWINFTQSISFQVPEENFKDSFKKFANAVGFFINRRRGGGGSGSPFYKIMFFWLWQISQNTTSQPQILKIIIHTDHPPKQRPLL